MARIVMTIVNTIRDVLSGPAVDYVIKHFIVVVG